MFEDTDSGILCRILHPGKCCRVAGTGSHSSGSEHQGNCHSSSSYGLTAASIGEKLPGIDKHEHN